MNALRLILSLPLRAGMFLAGVLTVITGAASVACLVVGLGFQILADACGGDRS